MFNWIIVCVCCRSIFRNSLLSCSLFLNASCHILMAALEFGTNYVWKSDKKYAVRFPDTANENGWAGNADGTGHLTVYCLSPSAHRSRLNPAAHLLPVEMKTSRLMGSIMAEDR